MSCEKKLRRKTCTRDYKLPDTPASYAVGEESVRKLAASASSGDTLIVTKATSDISIATEANVEKSSVVLREVQKLENPVAQCNDIKYDSVSAAVSAASEGDVVKVLADATEINTSGPALTIGKAITLDGDGHTVTLQSAQESGSSFSYGVAVNANAALKNVTFTRSDSSTPANNDGGNQYGCIWIGSAATDVALDGVTVDLLFGKDKADYRYALISDSNGKLAVKNCKLTAKYAMRLNGTGGEVTVSDSTAATGWAVTAFRKGNNNKVTFDNCTLSSTNYWDDINSNTYAMFWFYGVKNGATVNNATANADEGVGNTVTVENSKLSITANGTAYQAIAGSWADSDNYATKEALESRANKVVLGSGNEVTMTAASGTKALFEYSDINVEITGGTFNVDPRSGEYHFSGYGNTNKESGWAKGNSGSGTYNYVATGCGVFTSDDKYTVGKKCTVTYNQNYSGAPTAGTVDAIAGQTLTEPTAPTRTGYTFGGWYTNAEGTGSAWSFSTDTVTDTTTLYAKWTEASTPTETAVQKATRLINALPAANAVKATDESDITAARTAYDALTAAEKTAFPAATLKKLTDAEDALAVVKVNAALNALPAADKVAATDEAAITAARTAYDKLTAAQKQQVTADTLKKLTDAEEALAVVKVNAAINALPAADKVKTTDEAAITAARTAYDKLTTAQKAKVTAATLKKLTDAESALTAAKDKAAVDNVAALIEKLPSADKAAAADKDAVDAAQKAFDALTDAQKKQLGDAAATKLANVSAAVAAALPASETDLKTLAEAIDTAQKALDSLAPSADGTDVPKGTKWVSQADYDALSAAIDAAKAVAAKSGVTAGEAASAATSVLAAKDSASTASAAGKMTPVGSSFTVKAKTGSLTYKVTGTKTVTLTKAAKTTKKKLTVNTVKKGGVTYKVTAIKAKALQKSKNKTVVIGKNVKKVGAKAFPKAKATTLVVKSKKLTTKKSVKNMLKGSKVKTVQLKGLGSKKAKVKKAIKKYAGKSGLKFK